MGFSCGSAGKESACNAGDLGLISGLGRSPGEGNGYPIQYSCLENPMDRGAWWVTVHGVTRVRHDLVTKATNLDLRTLKPTGNWCLVRTNLGVDACYSFSDSFLSPTGVFLFPFIYFLIYVFISLFMYLFVLFRRRQWHPTPVLLPGKSHGQKSLAGYHPWGHKSQTWLSD